MTPLNKNFALLQQHHPELFALMQESISTSHLMVLPTKGGAAQLLVTSATGDHTPLHDPDNPLQAIQYMAKQIAPHLSGVRVLLGFELGYLAKFLCHQLPHNAALIFYEADPAIFLMALNIVDLTDVLSHPRVAIHVGPQANLRPTCLKFLSQVGGPLDTTIYGPSFQLNQQLYQEKVQRELTNMTSLADSAQQIIEWDGTLLTNNLLKNIPHIMNTPSAIPLQNVFQNIPALLVAAGPSLEKNVRHLKAAKGQAVLIVADTALGYLLDHGVVPDIVVSIDPQEATSQKYEHLTIPQEITLLYHPATHHQLVEKFPGPKLTMDVSLPAYEWLQAHWTPKGQFDQDATCQIQAGFNLAAWMGCNPLVLVGHDLCFTDEGMHVSTGSYLSKEETTPILDKAHVKVDSEGHSVNTTPTLEHDKLVLEKKIQDFRGTVVNATEGGLAISGVQSFLLQDVLSTYEVDHTIEVGAKLRNLTQDTTWKNSETLQQDIQDRLRDVFRIERTAHHVCRILTEMKDQQQQSGERTAYVLHLGRQVEHLTSFMPRYPQAQTLLCGMDQQIARRFAQDTLTCERESDPNLRSDREIDRGFRYYDSLRVIAPTLRHMLVQLLNQLGCTQPLTMEKEETLKKIETSELVNQ